MAFGCQKEDAENAVIDVGNQTNPSTGYKLVSLNELSKLEPVIDNIKKLQLGNSELARGETYMGVDNVLVDNIIQITNKAMSTYTFGIDTDFENSKYVENLVLMELGNDYLGYVMRYTPVTGWELDESNLTPEGDLVINPLAFDGDMTKYSLDGNVIWSTDSSALERGQWQEVCIYIDLAWCDYGGNLHPAGPNCTGNITYTHETICETVYFFENELELEDGAISSGGGGTGGSAGTNPPNEECTPTVGSLTLNNEITSSAEEGCLTNQVFGLLQIEDKEDCDTSKTDLKKVFTNMSDAHAELLASIINDKGQDFGIDTKEKLQHFLSQAGHEVGGFNNGFGVEESTNYTTKARLLAVFPSYYSETDTINKRKPDAYVSNPSGHANYVYCCRMGNGDEASGDGYKYRGRGIFQLTGKTNYTNFKSWYNEKYNPDKDFVANPELLKDNDTIAILSALWFYKTNVIDKITVDSTTTVKAVTLKINGGKNGLSDREEIHTKAKDSITCL